MKVRQPRPGNSFAEVFPELVGLWHPTKNGDLTPALVSAKAGVVVWWQCVRGHEWERRVIDTARGRRCPECFGFKITAERSMAAKFPEFVAEWHPTKNGDLLPTQVTPVSGKRIWWQCRLGHEWQAQVSSRTSKGTGCPSCANRRVTADNSLAALRPELAADWHPTKNGEMTPHDLTIGSSARVWWQCSAGHEWQTTLTSRVSGNGCKICSNRVAHRGYNLLLTNPELAAEWHPSLNDLLTPADVTPSSSQSVWWKCAAGHEWRAAIGNRHRGSGCRYCSGSRALPETSLAALNPAAAAQWHPTKNGELTPSVVRPRAGSKVWWQCRKGHEWQAAIFSIDKGGGCPYCLGVKPTADNNLSVVAPEVAAQWHPTKNGDLTPEGFVRKSRQRVWWKCPNGVDHEWEAFIYARTRGQQCPFCSGRAASQSTNLTATLPEVAAQWHPTKNGDLTPGAVSAGSSRKVWWVCPNNPEHEWRTEVSARVRNWRRRQGGCPFCSETGFQIDQPGWLYLLEGPAWGKFGITNNLDQRTRQHGYHGVFGALIGSWYFEVGQRAREIERKLLELLATAPTAPRDVPGHSESFPAVMTDMVLSEIHRLIGRP